MKYLARILHLPGGEVVNNHVVFMESGIVHSWQPFEAESHSMMLVDELLVSPSDNLAEPQSAKACADTGMCGALLYLYSVSDGKLQRIL